MVKIITYVFVQRIYTRRYVYTVHEYMSVEKSATLLSANKDHYRSQGFLHASTRKKKNPK